MNTIESTNQTYIERSICNTHEVSRLSEPLTDSIIERLGGESSFTTLHPTAELSGNSFITLRPTAELSENGVI